MLKPAKLEEARGAAWAALASAGPYLLIPSWMKRTCRSASPCGCTGGGF